VAKTDDLIAEAEEVATRLAELDHDHAAAEVMRDLIRTVASQRKSLKAKLRTVQALTREVGEMMDVFRGTHHKWPTTR
jgi:hypothetical protein